ncbi:MAG: hypothetical protein HGA44_23640, partial [Cellulomonadaceae bacterium]|nr:hypothetical protein [Cellulomonadaceae bacterium]
MPRPFLAALCLPALLLTACATSPSTPEKTAEPVSAIPSSWLTVTAEQWPDSDG